MKKLFIILIAMPLFSFAQMNTDLYYGVDSHGRMIATWSVGYEKGIIGIQGEIRPSVSRNVEAHNYMGSRLSLNLVNPESDGVYISPGVAYLYDLKSQDKTNLNKWYWAPTLKTGMMLNERAGLGFDVMYINKSVQASFGIHYLFK